MGGQSGGRSRPDNTDKQEDGRPFLPLWRLNEKVCMVVRRQSPSKRETESQTYGGGRRQQAERRPLTTGRNSKQKEKSAACACMSHDHARTHAPANSIRWPPPAPPSLLIKSPLCWLDATASNCVAAASRSRPLPLPPFSPSSAPTSSHPRHPRHVTSLRYTSIKSHQAHN